MGSSEKLYTGGGTESRVLGLLKCGNPAFVSGEEISTSLGISRSGVWKHIKSLREKGFEIEGVSKRGYRLKGDLPSLLDEGRLRSLLGTGFIGREIRIFESLESTNTTAFDLARGGAAEGTVVIAESQRGGKGRLGRRWFSPPGVNLYTSVVLRPKITPRDSQSFTLLAAVALADTISAFTPERVDVKWPNDILYRVGGKALKVAGILTEASSEAERVNFLILGIGININVDCDDLPSEIKGVGTSLRELTGRVIDRNEVAALLYKNLEVWYGRYFDEGLSPVLEAWRRYFPSEGKVIRVRAFDEVIEGLCVGLDDDGALLLKVGGGEVKRIISGDLLP